MLFRLLLKATMVPFCSGNSAHKVVYQRGGTHPNHSHQPVLKGSKDKYVLVGGLVAIFYFPIYWVANHPN